MLGWGKRGSLTSSNRNAEWGIAAAVLLFVLGGPAAMAQAPCPLREVASLPAAFQDGQIKVDVAINGQTVKFRLGTAAALSSIKGGLARRLNLPIGVSGRQILTARGTARPDTATISEIKIGRIVGHNARFLIDDYGGDGTTDQFAGTLGIDYLDNFDIEIDPAQHRVNLFEPLQCANVYWADEHFELPFTKHDIHNSSVVPVALDGQEFNARISTSSRRSSIDVTVAHDKLGLPADIDAHPPSLVYNKNDPPNPTYVFKTLVFGPITIRNPVIELLRYRTIETSGATHIKATNGEDAPVIIGMDILGKFHSMISNGTRVIYFTLPNERRAAAALPASP